MSDKLDRGEEEIDLFGHLLNDTVRFEFRPTLDPNRIIRLPAYPDRIRELPNTFDKAQRQFSRQYWQCACSVCGKPTEGFDHWIPISSLLCPGTIALNMIPMCIHCNLVKGNRNEAWLAYEFGADYIDRVHSYFGIIADQFDL